MSRFLQSTKKRKRIGYYDTPSIHIFNDIRVCYITIPDKLSFAYLICLDISYLTKVSYPDINRICIIFSFPPDTNFEISHHCKLFVNGAFYSGKTSMLNQQCKEVKTGQIVLSHYISNTHNYLFNNQLWEISITKNMPQLTILSDIIHCLIEK